MNCFSSGQRKLIVFVLAIAIGVILGIAHWDDTTTLIVGIVCVAFLGLFGTAFALWPEDKDQ